jgi:hypothetical protein
VFSRVDGRERLEASVESARASDPPAPTRTPDKRGGKQEDQEGVAGVQGRDRRVQAAPRFTLTPPAPTAENVNPIPPPLAGIERRDRLGGLIHEYHAAA